MDQIPKGLQLKIIRWVVENCAWSSFLGSLWPTLPGILQSFRQISWFMLIRQIYWDFVWKYTCRPSGSTMNWNHRASVHHLHDRRARSTHTSSSLVEVSSGKSKAVAAKHRSIGSADIIKCWARIYCRTGRPSLLLLSWGSNRLRIWGSRGFEE